MSRKILLLSLLLSLVACSQPVEAPAETEPVEAEPPTPEGDPVATLHTNKGDIVVKLLPESAPKSVEQFMKLAQAGYYIRTTFHEVQPEYILGGCPLSRDNDPTNDGKGSTGKWIGAEFDPELQVTGGLVGMWHKKNDPDSASCQFFITLKRMKDWDGKYNIFGQVIEGMEVVEKISKAKTIQNNYLLKNRPAGKQLIKGIDIEYRVFEEEKEEAL